jgi:hypothetical protein
MISFNNIIIIKKFPISNNKILEAIKNDSKRLKQK